MQKLTVEQYKEISQQFSEIYNIGVVPHDKFQRYLKTISAEETVQVNIQYDVNSVAGVLRRSLGVLLPKAEADILNNAGPYPELKAGNITIGTITKVEIIK